MRRKCTGVIGELQLAYWRADLISSTAYQVNL